MFVGALSNGPAKETGVALVQNVNNPIIVNVLSSFSDFVAARGTQSDLFGYRLITIWTKFHKRFSRILVVSDDRARSAHGERRARTSGECFSIHLTRGFDYWLENIRKFAGDGKAKPWRLENVIYCYVGIYK
jgi:hypothetical protein